MSPRTGGLAGDGPVSGDSGGGDRTSITKKPHEAIQRRDLPRAGATLRKVADQADADSVLVVVVARRLAVGAVLLLVPARTNLDLTIACAGAVSNHEMITQLVPTLIAMLAIKQLRRTARRRAVMKHNGRPSPAEASTDRKPRRWRRRTFNHYG